MRPNPILVTGSHRSGTTWIGKTISYSASTHYLGEIFNPSSGILAGLAAHWFHYVTPQETAKFRDAVGRILSYEYAPRYRKRAFRRFPSRLRLYRLTRQHLGIRRPILKDPIAAMSSEWLARVFDMDVICVVRHPAAFVLSLKKARWSYDHRKLLDQPSLIKDWLRPYEGLLCRPATDLVEGGSILWLCIYHVSREYQTRNPEWQVLRLEDVALSPQAAFRAVFERLGLPFTRRILAHVVEDSSSSNPVNAPADDPHLIKRNSCALRDQWRTALTSEEVGRVREIAAPVSNAFYGPEDW